jgi:hypothetical protein
MALPKSRPDSEPTRTISMRLRCASVKLAMMGLAALTALEMGASQGKARAFCSIIRFILGKAHAAQIGPDTVHSPLMLGVLRARVTKTPGC